jgi:hypothetical protein
VKVLRKFAAMLLGMAAGLMFLQAGEAFYNVNELYNGMPAGFSMMAFAVALVVAAIIVIPKDGGEF